MQKIINCYCAECVGRSTLGVAPVLFNFKDTPLANPNGCMCDACLGGEYKPTAKIVLEFNDTDASQVECPCFDCMGKGAVYKSPKKAAELVVTKSKTLYEVRTKDVKFFDAGKYPNRRYNLVTYTKTRRAYIPWYNMSKHYRKSSINSYTDATISNGSEVAVTLRNTTFYDYDLCIIPANKYTYSYGGLEVRFDRWSWHEKSIDELFTSGILYKILYYGEYAGYYTELNCYDDPMLFVYKYRLEQEDDYTYYAETIIENRGKTNQEIIDGVSEEYRSAVFKILDSYCYECSKYKGACLGHDIPDEDEYGNITRSIKK